MTEVNTDSGQIIIDKYPNQCPWCHNSITPIFLWGHKRSDHIFEIFMFCPDEQCKKSFIGCYNFETSQRWRFNGNVTRGNIVGEIFSDTINSLSNAFVAIYNQSHTAEQEGLTEICGVGFRKALEFLIKDYAISNHRADKEKIENKPLALCIEKYVTDDRIKIVAKRAVWLGNDETHYVRKWEGKNLEDLKKLIDLTIHWIEMESLTKSFEAEMPELKK